MMTTSQLQSLVFTGGSIIVDANNLTASSLQSIALTAKAHNSIVVIKNASKLSSSQCNSIAFSGGQKGNIIFDFTE